MSKPTLPNPPPLPCPQETKAVFEKLHKYIGKNIRQLVEGGPAGDAVLRLQRNRIYYVRADLMRRATNVRLGVEEGIEMGWRGSGGRAGGRAAVTAGALADATRHPTCRGSTAQLRPNHTHFITLQIARDKLVHLGTCIGKLTHSGKFRLTVGALDLLAQYAKYKVRAWRVGGWAGRAAWRPRRRARPMPCRVHARDALVTQIQSSNRPPLGAGW